MSSTPRKRYTREFKEQAVQLIQNGSPVAQVSRDLEVNANLLYKWSRQFKPEQQAQDAQSREIARLKKEIQRLKLDNAILKKSAVLLGSDPFAKNED